MSALRYVIKVITLPVFLGIVQVLIPPFISQCIANRYNMSTKLNKANFTILHFYMTKDWYTTWT